ncbi:MAG: HNH endonuclease [Solibacillus sp.]
MLKILGEGLGSIIDTTFKGAGNLASKGAKQVGLEQTADFIEETAQMVGKASNAGLSLTGQTAQGIYQTAKGQLTQDAFERNEGVDELKDAGKRLVTGLGQTLKMGATNTYETGAGLLTKDFDRAKHGAKNLAQLGIVAFTAVSIIDIIDSADAVAAQEIQTINASLDGSTHPISGVPFETNTITHDGLLIEEVFPVFTSAYDVMLPESTYLASDSSHFNYANAQLLQSIEGNPALAGQIGLTQADLAALQSGSTPEGYVWHHHEEPGKLQLVSEVDHSTTAHTGGRFIWAGGSEYR